MAKRGKTHYVRSIVFDTASVIAFDNVASVAAGVANTAIQARVAVPCRCKVLNATGNLSAIGSGGTHSFSVVKGTGAPGAAPSEDTLAAANATLIPATALVTADTPVTVAATQPDGILAKGDLVTLRAVTPATTGSMTNLKVALTIVPMDGNPGSNSARNF